MHLFYLPPPIGDRCTLSPDDSHHAVGVLRLGAGDRVRLTDGAGTWAEGVIQTPSPRACEVQVVERTEGHGRRPYRLHVGIAPTKNSERYEWFLEKAAELGIDRITPLLCDRSERRTVKHDRSAKILLSAMKQSQGAYLPALDELTPFARFVAELPAAGVRLIAHCEPDDTKIPLAAALPPGQSYTLLIGPEGDFSPAEIELARAAGFQSITLGSSRLRTETAALLAVAAATLANS